MRYFESNLSLTFISFNDLKYTYPYKAVKRILIVFEQPLLVQRCNGTTAGLGYLQVNVICSCKSPHWAHCNENPIHIFPEKELRGLSPISHVSVSDLFIPRISSHIFLQQNRQTDRGNI